MCKSTDIGILQHSLVLTWIYKHELKQRRSSWVTKFIYFRFMNWIHMHSKTVFSRLGLHQHEQWRIRNLQGLKISIEFLRSVQLIPGPDFASFTFMKSFKIFRWDKAIVVYVLIVRLAKKEIYYYIPKVSNFPSSFDNINFWKSFISPSDLKLCLRFRLWFMGRGWSYS